MKNERQGEFTFFAIEVTIENAVLVDLHIERSVEVLL